MPATKLIDTDGMAVSSAVSAALRHLVAKGTITPDQATEVQDTANTFMTALYSGMALAISPDGTVEVTNPEEVEPDPHGLRKMEVGGHA